MADEFDSGINVIASRVGMDISNFIENAQNMNTYLDVINVKLKSLDNVKVNVIFGDTIKQLEGIGKVALAEQRNQARIIAETEASRAKSAANVSKIMAQEQLVQQKIVTEGLKGQKIAQQLELNKSEGMFDNYYKRLRGMTMHHMNWFMTGGLLMFGGELFKEGIVDFETGMAGVVQVLEETYKKLGQELSPEEMARIGEGFATIAERWGESIETVLEASKDWGRQYKDVNTIQELVNSTTLLSVVDNLSLAESVKGLESTMNQYGMVATSSAEAQQYSMRIVDSWSAVAHKSMISAQDLAQGNEKAASSARMMGIDFDHLQGMLAAAVRSTGRSGNELGNTLKTMFASLHSDKAVEELHKLGVEVKDMEGNFRPAQAVFEDLMIAMAGTEQNVEGVVQAVSSGKFQWSKAAAMLGDYETYIKATAQSINSAGMAEEYMAVQMDTVARKAGQLHQALIALVNSAGNEGLTGTIKDIIDNLRYLIDGLNNGGMKAVAFGIGIVGAANATVAINKAIKDAKKAQESWNVTMAISKALTGNWVGLLTAGVVAGVALYSINLGKAANKQTELLEREKQEIEIHRQKADQYNREIEFIQQLELQRNKLSDSLKTLSDGDERKAQLNKNLQATEEALAEAVGEEAAANMKNAQYSHTAFQSLVTSLQDKQAAEKVAWENSQKIVSESTDHLRKELTKQIEQLQNTAKAYSLFGRVQETQLASQKSAAEQRIKYWEELASRPWNLQPPGMDVSEELEKAKDNLADINAEIDDLYGTERDNKIAKLLDELNKLGGSSFSVDLNDIPGMGDFKNEPFPEDDSKELAQLAKEAEQAAQKMRQLALTMADNKIRAYTDDTRLLDAYMQTHGETMDNLLAKETDYHNAVIETRNERTLVQSQIQELSKDTAKYAEEIENLKNKDRDLAIQEQELINKQTEMIALKIKNAYETERDAEIASVDSQIDKLNDEKTKLEEYYKDLEDGYQERIDSLENSIEANDTYYSSLIDPLNEQLDALDRTNQALDEQNKLLDLRNNLEKLYQERMNIESEENVRVWDGDKWTYQANQAKLNDVNERIQDAQKAVSDQELQISQNQQKQTIQDQIKTYETLRDARRKELEDSKRSIQNLMEDARREKEIEDGRLQVKIDNLNEQKTALNTYWNSVLDDTKISQDALSQLQNEGYVKSLTDAQKYYDDAKKSLEAFGSEAMAYAQRVHDNIAASLAIASQSVSISHDNSVNIGNISTNSNLGSVLGAMKQLAVM